MRAIPRKVGRPATCLARYGQNMGRLIERHVADAALLAARQEAEREAAEARLAKAEIEATNAVLHAEVANRLRAQTRLAYLASHDSLTGLSNRALFSERLGIELEKARRHGRKVALLYIDLDNFKDVNDTLGHASGDALLVQVSRRIEAELRAGEMVARLGGDEFAVLQIEPDGAAQAEALGQRLIASISQPVDIDGRMIFVGASIGVTLFPDDADTVELLHRNADLAMYRAKGEGRNRTQFFDATLNQEVHRRACIEQGLREPGLMSQLRILFQPQIDVRSHRVTGAEALLRWTHPDHGLIPPDEFISVAERSGRIIEIGEWVLRETCRQAARWRQLGLPKLTVAINIATQQFRGKNMPRLVAEVLAETGLPASWLELEITETGIMHDMHVAAETLVALHQQGVGLAIDDFGTGYSSLSYLRRLPVDRIKIDRSFVNDVTASEDAAVVATTIVKLAHSLRLQVVAEGVETPEQAEFVATAGCAFAQGYLYGRPSSAVDLIGLLAKPPRRIIAPAPRSLLMACDA